MGGGGGHPLYPALLNERRGREEDGEGGDWLNKEGSMGTCVMSLPLSVLGAQGRSLPGELKAGQQVDSHCQEEQRSECRGQPAH